MWSLKGSHLTSFQLQGIGVNVQNWGKVLIAHSMSSFLGIYNFYHRRPFQKVLPRGWRLERKWGQKQCVQRTVSQALSAHWADTQQRRSRGHTAHLSQYVWRLPPDGSPCEPEIHSPRHLGSLGANCILLWDKYIGCHSKTSTYCHCSSFPGSWKVDDETFTCYFYLNFYPWNSLSCTFSFLKRECKEPTLALSCWQRFIMTVCLQSPCTWELYRFIPSSLGSK